VAPGPARPRASLLPGLVAQAAVPPAAPEHVALAACRSFELAQEKPLGGRTHGVFSWALLQALGRLGPTATYRDLLIAAQTEVALRAERQVPQVSPPVPGIADRPFLGGAVRAPGAPMVMRYARDGWEIDAGSAHGLPVTGGVKVGVPGHRPLREADVVRVLSERSIVEPAGSWQPDRQDQPRVVLTGVPFPRTTVGLGDPRLLAALRTAGPGGGPSPHVRAIPPDDPAEVPDLRVVVEPPGVARIVEHGAPLGPAFADLDGAGARRCVAALEHIARWRQVRDLANPVTRLTGAVRVEIVAAPDGVARAPETGPVLRPDDGVHRLRYRRGPDGWEPPHVFIRLRNTTGRRLFCVLLDLTGRFRVHAGLFPGAFVAAGRAGAAVRGERVAVRLPAGVEPEPGRYVRDWLKLIVAEEQFGAEPFVLPELGGDVRRAVREAPAAPGLIERLGGRAVHRDLGAAAEQPPAYDWATALVPLVTEVPRDAARSLR
jgi:hypothetical protein